MSDDVAIKLKQIIEGALLAAGEPLSVDRIAGLFSELDGELPSPIEIHAALDAIKAECEGRGFELKEVASGYRFQVRQDLSLWISRLWDERPQRYTRALLETLALIAYRQPITRAEIEQIRGVAVSTQTIKTLQEREWVRIVGHRDIPGRPAMFATTRGFLDYFNLKNLDELPTLSDIRDLDKLNQELQLDYTEEPRQIVSQILDDEEIDELEEIETTQSIIDESEDE
jgi:segregation and condensation protein B